MRCETGGLVGPGGSTDGASEWPGTKPGKRRELPQKPSGWRERPIRYLRLRVALLFFSVNALRQRNDEKFPPGYRNPLHRFGCKLASPRSRVFGKHASDVPRGRRIDPPLSFQ